MSNNFQIDFKNTSDLYKKNTYWRALIKGLNASLKSEPLLNFTNTGSPATTKSGLGEISEYNYTPKQIESVLKNIFTKCTVERNEVGATTKFIVDERPAFVR